VSQGFPAVPFFVDEDLTRADGVISCRPVTSEEIAKFSWKALRLLRLLTKLPIEF
jgi:hypothetical protein